MKATSPYLNRPLRTSAEVYERHQIKIARDTLKMSDAGALIMGGMTKGQARNFLHDLGWSKARIAKLEA